MKKQPMLLFGFAAVLMVWGLVMACDTPSGDSIQDDDDDDNDDNNDDNDDNNDNDDNDDNNDDDNDDNGGFDPDEECDCDDLSGNSAEDMGKAMNICSNVINAETWSSSPSPSEGFAIIEDMGDNDCIVNQHGCQMIAISTGPVGQENPNVADSVAFGDDGMADVADDPLPPFQGEEPTTSAPYASCDNLQLKFRLKAPEGAEGFSFDFLYASAEYDEWINMGYNDAFYAILESSGLNGGEPTNISFDDNGSEVEVDVNFFENSSHPCDETGSGWEPAVEGKSGSTGWLRTTWPIEEEEEFNLTFSIHDEGDCIFDSIVFIDNFQWQGEPVDPGTGPI